MSYGYWDKAANMEEMIGKTFTHASATDDELHLTCAEGTFKLLHTQDCCEHVYIESIVGDLTDLVGTPILYAEEVSNADDPPDYTEGYDESHTWTFYKMATIKGYVDIRFLGSSNGYYGESASLYFFPNKEQDDA